MKELQSHERFGNRRQNVGLTRKGKPKRSRSNTEPPGLS